MIVYAVEYCSRNRDWDDLDEARDLFRTKESAQKRVEELKKQMKNEEEQSKICENCVCNCGKNDKCSKFEQEVCEDEEDECYYINSCENNIYGMELCIIREIEEVEVYD